MFQHTKQFCCIGAKPRLCFHPYAGLQLNCTARSGNMIYYSCDCVTPAPAAESLLATAATQRKSVYVCERDRDPERSEYRDCEIKSGLREETAGNMQYLYVWAGVVPLFMGTMTFHWFSCSFKYLCYSPAPKPIFQICKA